MDILREGGVEFNVLVVVNRLTGDFPDKLYYFFLEKDLPYLQFVPCVEKDPITGEITDWSVRPGQYGSFLCRLFDRWYNYGHPEVSVRMFNNLVGIAMGQPAESCELKEKCDSYFIIEYNGDVYPCDFFVNEDWHLGNLMETPLWEIGEAQLARKFADDKAEPQGECESSQWLSVCLKGCQRYRGVKPGKRDYICSSLKTFFSHAAPRIASLAADIKGPQAIAPPPAAVMSPDDLKPSRNAPCPCGSRKNYKQCCGKKVAQS